MAEYKIKVMGLSHGIWARIAVLNTEDVTEESRDKAVEQVQDMIYQSALKNEKKVILSLGSGGLGYVICVERFDAFSVGWF